MWGIVKDKVYQTLYLSLKKLKRRMTSAIRSVTTQTVENLWKNAEDHQNTIVRGNGGHIEHVQRYAKTLDS